MIGIEAQIARDAVGDEFAAVRDLPVVGDEMTNFVEQGLIGTLLVHPGELHAVAEFVTKDMFVDNWRSMVFAAMQAVSERGMLSLQRWCCLRSIGLAYTVRWLVKLSIPGTAGARRPRRGRGRCAKLMNDGG